MKERGLRSPWGSGSLKDSGFPHLVPLEEEEAPMEREYVGIDFHRRRSVIVRLNAAGEKLSSVRVANDPLVIAAAVAEAGPDAQRWWWRPPTAGTGWWTC